MEDPADGLSAKMISVIGGRNPDAQFWNWIRDMVQARDSHERSMERSGNGINIIGTAFPLCDKPLDYGGCFIDPGSG